MHRIEPRFPTPLGLVVLAALLLSPVFSGCAIAEASSPSGTSSAKARNIILLIGDGMGPSQFGAARLYSNRVLGKDLKMVEVMQAGRTAYLANGTADSVVAESAAIATQIACGVKVPARAAGMGSDGKTPCKTILEIAKERGMATGLVTTSGITDATPASFSAHVPDRSDEESVAAQQLAAGVDILMGGRKRFFLPRVSAGKRRDGRNLMDEARAAGYTVVGDAGELRAATGPRILGLFSMGNMAYEVDRAPTLEPSLAEMTAKTLEVLSQNRKGFFAMIEGGRIDHAAHRNDAAGTIRDLLAFDEAVGVALQFASQHSDTLLVVTADHETGGMVLIDQARPKREGIDIKLSAIQQVGASYEVMQDELGKKPTPEKVKAVVKKYMGVELTDDEAMAVASDVTRRVETFGLAHDALTRLSLILRSHLGIAWGTQAHTATPLYAFGMGPGSEKIVGFRHNTDLFFIMKDALGH